MQMIFSLIAIYILGVALAMSFIDHVKPPESPDDQLDNVYAAVVWPCSVVYLGMKGILKWIAKRRWDGR